MVQCDWKGTLRNGKVVFGLSLSECCKIGSLEINKCLETDEGFIPLLHR